MSTTPQSPREAPAGLDPHTGDWVYHTPFQDEWSISLRLQKTFCAAYTSPCMNPQVTSENMVEIIFCAKTNIDSAAPTPLRQRARKEWISRIPNVPMGSKECMQRLFLWSGNKNRAWHSSEDSRLGISFQSLHSKILMWRVSKKPGCPQLSRILDYQFLRAVLLCIGN